MSKDTRKDEDIISIKYEDIIPIKDVCSFYNSIKSLDWKTEMIQDWAPTTDEGISSLNELAHRVEELEATVEDLESRLDILLKNNSETNDSNLIEAIENALKKYQYFNY